MNQGAMKKKMKEDSILRDKNERIYIRVDGELKSLISWLDDPRVKVSDRQLRRRIREYELGQLKMSISDILFKSPRKEHKAIKPDIPHTEIEKWRETCKMVLTSKIMTL